MEISLITLIIILCSFAILFCLLQFYGFCKCLCWPAFCTYKSIKCGCKNNYKLFRNKGDQIV